MWTFRSLLTILLRRRLIVARVTFISRLVFLKKYMQNPRFQHGLRQSPRLLRDLKQNSMRIKAATLITRTRTRTRATTILGAIPDIVTKAFSIGPGNIDQ
jgi:hypothetical protein